MFFVFWSSWASFVRQSNLVLLICLSGCSLLFAGTSGGEEVEFFAAMAEKKIEVMVVPRDSTTVTLQIQNQTKQPIAIRMPPGLAAAPVLTQQPFNIFNNNGNNINNGNQNSNNNQAVGIQQPKNNNNNNAFPNVLFNVPAERTLKIKLPAVCLEHGKPEPNTRVKYELVPLDRYSKDSRLSQTLSAIGNELDQRTAQLVAWHLVNEKSWSELAALKVKHIDGFSTPQFTKKEIQRAQAWFEKLPAERVESQVSARE